jgi:hypothetical protein
MSIIIVSGFGRCGSSLVMQMLHAGGIAVTGQWPSFEHPAGAIEGPLLSGKAAAAAQLEGHAIKVLDPHLGRLPRGFDYRVIWCSRDFGQQAKSQIKLLRLWMGIAATREDCRRFERSYRADFPKAMAALRAAGVTEILQVQFEDTLAKPLDVARSLAAFCELPHDAIEKMAAGVRARDAACAPGMDMEMELLESRHA